MRLGSSSPDPDAARDLAAVEAALAGEPVPADLDHLAELTHALRADRPVPSTRFALELDALTESGFHRAPTAREAGEPAKPLASPRRGLRLRARRHTLSLAIGTAASLFIVAAGVLSSGVLTGGGAGDGRPAELEEPLGDRVGGATEGPPVAGSEQAAPSGGAAADATKPQFSSPSPPTARQGRIAPRVRNRVVERQADLTLATPPQKVEGVADEVIRVTDRYRGFVLASTITGGEQARGANLDLRIPAGRLQPAIADLSELAHVRSRTQSTQDVTAAVVSLRERLQDRLAERSGLLRQLAVADTANDTASLRARLRLANRRIARLRGALERQRTRVEFAAVAVTVEADPGADGGNDGGWSVGDALDDAVAVLGTAIGVLLISLAVLIPTALVGLLAMLVGRRALRERRERALDRSSGFANSPRR